MIAIIERTNRTIEECLSKYIGQYQHERTKVLPLAIKAYPSIHSVRRYNPACVVLGFLLSLSTDCIYGTTQIAIYATPITSYFTVKQKLQKTHQLMPEFLAVKQEPTKTYFNSSRYGPSYKVGGEVSVFNSTVKKEETRKFAFFYRGLCTIIEIRNEKSLSRLSFRQNKKGFSMPFWPLSKFYNSFFGETAELLHSLLKRSYNFEWSAQCNSAVTD